MGFKLGEKSELVAMKSAGMSLRRIMNPLIIFVFFVSIGSFMFSNYVMPIANLKSGSLLYSIQKQKPALNIKAGVFYNGIEGYSIKVGKKTWPAFDRDKFVAHQIELAICWRFSVFQNYLVGKC